MYERKIPIDADCGVNVTLSVIGGKWKPYLVRCMTNGFRRPSDFRNRIPGASKRVLTQQLSELESAGIVRKVPHFGFPLRTEYFLTELGESLVPIIRQMDEWGNRHRGLFFPKKEKGVPAS